MIKCASCNEEIVKPLEIYGGGWFCPYCKKSVFPNEKSRLEITPENHRLMLLSDNKFYKEFLLGVNANDGENLDGIARRESLAKAIDLCREAAYSKNPFALINLGLYYKKGYIDSSLETKVRNKTAWQLFKAVYSNETLGDSFDEDTIAKLKKLSAKNMLDSFVKEGGISKEELEKVCGTVNSSIEEDDEAQLNEENLFESMFEIANTMNKNDGRQPLFALLTIDNGENSKEIFQNISNTKKEAFKSMFQRQRINVLGIPKNYQEDLDTIELFNSEKDAELQINNFLQERKSAYFLIYNKSLRTKLINVKKMFKELINVKDDNIKISSKQKECIDDIIGVLEKLQMKSITIFAEDIFVFYKNNYCDALLQLFEYISK